jgi:DNA-binding NarL/FixJ family response regulator
MLTVTLVEDQREYRAFVERTLAASSEFCLLQSYTSASEALAGIVSRPPDIVLTDIGLPGMGGIELVSRLKMELPAVNIVMITVFEDDDNIFSALQAGAGGYILKHAAIKEPQRLLNTLREVHEGGSSMSPTIAQRVLEFFRQNSWQNNWQSNQLLVNDNGKNVGKPPGTIATQSTSELAALTPREHEILSLLAQGFSDKELAEKLFLSVHTVRTHNTNIYGKLQVRTRSEAVARFFKR